MGFDKQLIKINDLLIVDYISEILREFFHEIVVVTKRPNLYEGRSYILASDEYPGLGPMAGIHAGLKKISSYGAYVTACDMPVVNRDYVEFLVEKFEDNDTKGIISAYDGFIEPMAGIYSKDLVDEMEIMLQKKDLKLKGLIDSSSFIKVSKEDLLRFDKDLRFFENINYYKDLENL